MERYTPTQETIAAALERDSAWLHGLARALTRDADAASDVAQTTLLRAWQRAVGGMWPPRAWLARVATNAVREAGRRDGTRRAKEEAVARPEAEAGACALERLEIQRQVADAVEALSEPYRRTLVLRYFDGLSPRAIAAREGVPTKTVYTRIERGLARLRQQLDSRYGNDRAGWVGALLALPRPGWSSTSLLIGGGAMGLAMKLAGGAAVIVIGALVWMRSDSPRASEAQPPGESVAAASLKQPVENEDQTPAPEAAASSARTPAAVTEEPGHEPAAPVAPSRVALGGRVLGADGQPLPGVGVRVRRWEETGADRALSDGNGHFELDWERARLPVTLVIDDERYASLREAHVNRTTAGREHVIVAARAADLRGTVVDEHGLPLADAAVTLIYPDDLLVDFPLVLDATTRVQPRTITDANGRFELLRTSVAEGCELRAQLRGYEIAQVELTEPFSSERTIELRSVPEAELDPLAEGLVLLPDGTPAEGATVRYGGFATKTDPDGRFQLPLDHDPDPDLQLAAGLAGHGTALIEGYGELQAQASPYAPAPVTLVLRESALSITGSVVNTSGDALSGWRVQLRTGTPLTRSQTPPVLAEAIDAPLPPIETNEAGLFRVPGLLDRDYELLVYHPRSLTSLHAGPFAAGARSVVIEVPDDLVYERVAGRIVSRRGLPVEKARVAVGLVLHKMENGSSWISGEVVETGSDGRFELTGVARDGVHLGVGGESIVPVRWEFEPGADVEDLVIEVALRCHFRVDVTGGDLDDLGILVEDAGGQRVTIQTYHATSSSGSSYKRLVDGRIGVSAVSEDATTLVLVRGSGDEQKELARRALHLVPGEVAEVQVALDGN